MIDIKLRGKSILDGTWIYGTGFTDFLNVYNKNDGRIFIWALDYRWVEIDPKTLSESTRLFDKNSVEIYGGDILKWKCSKSGKTSIKDIKLHTVVIYFSTKFHGYALTIYDNGEKWATNRSFWSDHDREIIGDIYENTELLEKTKSYCEEEIEDEPR